jgi:hypothetical protein
MLFIYGCSFVYVVRLQLDANYLVSSSTGDIHAVKCPGPKKNPLQATPWPVVGLLHYSV